MKKLYNFAHHTFKNSRQIGKCPPPPFCVQGLLVKCSPPPFCGPGPDGTRPIGVWVTAPNENVPYLTFDGVRVSVSPSSSIFFGHSQIWHCLVDGFGKLKSQNRRCSRRSFLASISNVFGRASLCTFGTSHQPHRKEATRTRVSWVVRLGRSMLMDLGGRYD